MQFNENGYVVDVFWKQKKNNSLVVWGKVNEGKSCKQLNISISFDNTKKSTAIGWVETYIKNYSSKRGGTYNVTDDVFASKEMKKSWFVDSIYLKCLQ
jgi:hypothetical protein